MTTTSDFSEKRLTKREDLSFDRIREAIKYDVVWHAVLSSQEYPPMALNAMGPHMSKDTVVNGADGFACRVDSRLIFAP